ncbi:GAF domain-containing protein [Hymenobacter busanensis]|uniref:GAF domain-containing protein n=1 Tax=Hymenobacter busanensis TaxID=2607656 RepID=A0A7L5A212_9BACT|nr:GAF domain-containing protein [Hymenobacter busanensis]KAA9327086.1 GAF domain-containing protein [Hymenobacter busanensis]QHJ09538.1 GAF domain-containing protein [Hymenobacter busanensis]
MPVDKRLLIPPHDKDRTHALARYRIADTPPEQLFDDLARLIARLFDMPIALVSLVTQDTVWFKANFGLPGAIRVPREDSLCSVAVLHGTPVVFENLTQSPCTLTNPDVAEALNLQFYAGVPLKTADGHSIGTVCVIDREPRTFSVAEQALLGRMAEVVMHTLELRLAALQDGSQSNAQLQLAFDSLRYSLDRLADAEKLARRSGGRSAAETADLYRVTGEIVDYVNSFVGGTLKLV